MISLKYYVFSPNQKLAGSLEMSLIYRKKKSRTEAILLEMNGLQSKKQ